MTARKILPLIKSFSPFMHAMVQDNTTSNNSLIVNLVNKGVTFTKRTICCKPHLFDKLGDLRSPKEKDLKRH